MIKLFIESFTEFTKYPLKFLVVVV